MRFDEQSVKVLASRYTTLKDFRRDYPGAHNFAWRHGLLKEFTWLKKLKRPCGSITKERCFEAARQFTTVSEFRRKAMTEYVASSIHGWLSEFDWLSRKNRPWNPENVAAIARQCRTMGEFYRDHHREYHYAYRAGLLPTFDWLVRDVKRWTVESVTEVARKYDTLGDFRKNDNAAYQYAWKNGLLGEFRWLARTRRNRYK